MQLSFSAHLSLALCVSDTLCTPPPNRHSFFRPCGDKNIFQIYDKHKKIVPVAAQFLSWHTAKEKKKHEINYYDKGGVEAKKPLLPPPIISSGVSL